jgi:ketosteroid isomerase-like protein
MKAGFQGENIMSNVKSKQRVQRDEADIRALIESVDQAHHDKDAPAIVAPYAPDAVVFDLAPPLLSQGATDRKELQAWLDTWEGPLDRDSSNFSITVSGNFAFCYGFFRLRGTPKGEDQPMSLWMRATLCLFRDEAGWRIVHEHTSVPFYMDGSYRAAVDLVP